MHTTYRSSILPLFAFFFTSIAFAYSACQDSCAQVKDESGFTVLKEQVRKFELALSDLKNIHADHVKQYSDQMGCTRDSKALEIINRHNKLIEMHAARLKYHQMKLTQSDTSDTELNNAQLLELKKDFVQLNIDGNEIRTGFDNMKPMHVTK